MKKSLKAQGMSINIVIIIVLALMALVLVGYFVITGFSEAGGSVTKTAGDIQTESDGISTGIGGIKEMWDLTYYCCGADNRHIHVADSCVSGEQSVGWTSESFSNGGSGGAAEACWNTRCESKCSGYSSWKIHGIGDTKCSCSHD